MRFFYVSRQVLASNRTCYQPTSVLFAELNFDFVKCSVILGLFRGFAPKTHFSTFLILSEVSIDNISPKEKYCDWRIAMHAAVEVDNLQ